MNQQNKNTVPTLVWDVYPFAQVVAMVRKAESARQQKDSQTVGEFLQDAKFLRSLIVMRGEANSFFKLLNDSFMFLVQKELDKSFSWSTANKKLIVFLREKNIPEQILNELAHVAFHLRNKKTFFEISRFIGDSQNYLKNKAVFARSVHDLASWHGVYGELEKALEENKRALTLAREIGEPVIELKTKFGLTYYKNNLKPRLQAEDYLYYSNALAKIGLQYDAIRAKIEAARMLSKVALYQEKKQKEKELTSAKNLALEALKSAKDIHYPNAEISAREVLGKIYAELGETRKLKSYKRGADDLRENYDYKIVRP